MLSELVKNDSNCSVWVDTWANIAYLSVVMNPSAPTTNTPVPLSDNDPAHWCIIHDNNGQPPPSVKTQSDRCKWLLTVNLPILALEKGKQARAEYIALFGLSSNPNDWHESPHIAIGQTYKVVRGRKVPHGTTGKVFWFGSSKFSGFSVGLKINRPDGNQETVFTSLNNLQYINDADVVLMNVAKDWYLKEIESWITKGGYERDSVRNRVIQVLTSIVKNNSIAPLWEAQELALAAMKGV